MQNECDGSLVPLCSSYIAISLYRVVQQVLCANKWECPDQFWFWHLYRRSAALSNQRRQRGTEGPESIHAFLAWCTSGESKVVKSRSVWFVANIGVPIFARKEQPAQRQDQRRRRDSYGSSDFASKEQAEVIRVELAGTSSAVSVRPCCDADRNGCSLEYLRIISVVTIRK
jgi:hypothetical protein